jgi:predicted O-linked N-acetylglucosamine transferase (SPINDLY family)
LRLGYFSADFHDHATMNLMAGLLDRHDRSRFDIHLFSYGDAIRDAMRQRAEACAGTFHDVGRMSDDAVVELATRAKLDIAIDLKGYTKDSRIGLFARRLAPLQVSWLGYPGTLGGDFIDYIIADAQIVPEADRCFYTEKIRSLPNSYQPNDDRRVISDHVFTRVELGLPEQGVVFCCFNNNSKIGPEEFDLWMELLAQVEGSVLWLFRDNNLAAANLAREAERRGIARDRLVFAGRMPQAEHLARQRCADIFLDTFTYNAHTTASDALWAGLPVITKCGRSFAARVAASLLHAIGMPEMVVQTPEDYRKLALDLATGPERLAAVKAKLAANRLSTALFDTVTFTRDIERVYDALHAERS